MRRELELTPARLRSYSRSGNFHSDPETAARLGYRGMVAQGMHVAGVAYGLFLDAWGDDFLAHGDLEVKFVGVVYDGQTVRVDCAPIDDDVAFDVIEGDRIVVAGRARRPPLPLE